jgi:hypothetical protein
LTTEIILVLPVIGRLRVVPFSPCDKLPHWFWALLQKFNPAASAL